MRAVVGILLALAATADADDAPPWEPSAFPTVDSEPVRSGVELHGVLAGWWTPWSEASPTAATDRLRVRFAVLRVDARATPTLTAIARVGFMLPTTPLLDFAATYLPHPAIGVTFGQFRLPIGAAATTLAPNIVMLDRPSYVYALSGFTFRDVGAMLHTGPGGVLDGHLHARLALTGGGGRVGSGGPARGPSSGLYLVAGRVLGEWGGHGDPRLIVGGSLVRSRDPAVTDPSLAISMLGRALVPIGYLRTTTLAGADTTVAAGPWWLQAEMLYLSSQAVAAPDHRRALGASVELAWELPVTLCDYRFQLATRGEHVDLDLDAPYASRQIGTLGVNVLTRRLRWSGFVTTTRFQDKTGGTHVAGEVTARAVAMF